MAAEEFDRVGAHEVVLPPDAVAHPLDDMGAGGLPDQGDADRSFGGCFLR
ncbi:hypothetical protein [Streptomyces sp. NPDC054874]